MISQLTGHISYRGEESIILDVNGVGYEVALSSHSLEKLSHPNGTASTGKSEKITLVIYTAVREDNISLYGFLNHSEKKLFSKLLSVSGIGPKLSMTILAGMAPQELIDAIYREDLIRLTAISGIGKKTAERMILELKDKLLDLVDVPRNEEKRFRKSGLPEDLISALVNLGYNRNEIEKKLERIELRDPQNFQQSLKESLQVLSK